MYLRQKSVRKLFSRQNKYAKLQLHVQVKRICAVFLTSLPFYGDITIPAFTSSKASKPNYGSTKSESALEPIHSVRHSQNIEKTRVKLSHHPK